MIKQNTPEVGDTVICTDVYPHRTELTQGKCYSVTKLDQRDNGLLYVVNDNGFEVVFRKDRFIIGGER